MPITIKKVFYCLFHSIITLNLFISLPVLRSDEKLLPLWVISLDYSTGMYEFIRDFRGEIPGARALDCGNYLDHNLAMTNYVANRYLENTLYKIDEEHLIYPEKTEDME